MQSDDMRDVWQAQGPAGAPLPLEELRTRAARFRSRIVRRNLREYLLMAGLLLYFSYFAWSAHLLLMRVGNGLLAAGLVYVAYQLHRRASASPAAGDLAWQNCVAFHRAQLERQRGALSGIWKWNIGPIVPGLATVAIALSIPAFRRSILAGLLSLLWIPVPVVVLWRVAWLNKGAAEKIQRQIDSLE